MTWIALKMLTGDRAKFFGIVFGVTFAALLIAQQSSIFCGLMLMTTGQIRDIQGADLWIMDPRVEFIDDIKPMSDNDLYRVRSVPGIDWAVRLYKGLARARMATGNFQQVILLGLDDATMVGAPLELIRGTLADLRRPDAFIIDERGYRELWKNEPLEVGKVIEMNDRRAVLVGICKASRTFQTFPVVYTRYSQAVRFAPPERKVLSFILAKAAPGQTLDELCARIKASTGLLAKTNTEFTWMTIQYYLERTGIPINFGITVVLGFLVGTAIAGQTFYLFTIENLKQFGSLKAMGVTNLRLVGMVLFQALVVGALGYCLGIGLAAAFGESTKSADKLGWFMPWHVFFGTGVAVVVIVLLSSLLSMRRVLLLEPAMVFR
ncbi:MAG TPA: ABC transporter permease [Gemmatales bacterium]|nr:ABC transporter permease [Gemmatales bacterium]